jgi:NhaA family Na+:H+ antiporter
MLRERLPITHARHVRRLAALLGFMRGESAGGMLLVAASLAAIAWANSPAAHSYQRLLQLPVALSVGGRSYAETLRFVVNNGLMTLFFLLVALEIRREVTEGQLASLSRAAAPVVAALGGMVVPALIYVAICFRSPGALHGWAIPVATDIAFSLAVLRLLGPAVPAGLKVFLTALAIIDDLGAILVIAVFYSDGIDVAALGAAGVVWLALLGLNRLGVRAVAPYAAGLLGLWTCMAWSGVHPTLAGVALAFAVPMRAPNSTGRRIEHGLHAWVGFIVLPLFGLFNAGLDFSTLSWGAFAEPVVPAIAIGLFAGKQIGVFGATWTASAARLIRLPDGLNWRLVYGGSVLCGIGFTVSLFIGNLAFADGARAAELKLAVFLGSIASAASGGALVASAVRRRTKAVPSHSANGVSASTSTLNP